MPATFSIILSIIALIFSIYVFTNSRKQNKRNAFLQIHDLLLSDEIQKGRQTLLLKVTDEASVRELSDEDYRDIHRALGILNALAYYMKSGYVDEMDALCMWAPTAYRACVAAQPLIRQREQDTGYRPFPYLDYLTQRTYTYMTNKGTIPQFKVWHRQGGAKVDPIDGAQNKGD